MTDAEWTERIGAKMALVAGEHRRATHFEHRYGSAQAPVRFTCDDGRRWIVKGPNSPRSAASEIVVSSIGMALGAPVPSFAYIKIPTLLVKRTPPLKQFNGNDPYPVGTWFGARFVEGVTDLVSDLKQASCLHLNLRENRRRYGHLAFLYGWAGTWEDQQFIFDTHDPCLVSSVDHGHFFPGASGWTADSVRNHSERARLEPMILNQVNFSHTELHAATKEFLKLDRVGVITTAVARPLQDWDITMADRVALAVYLRRRGDELAEEVTKTYGS